MGTVNLVLYAVRDGERKPLASFDPGVSMLAARVTAKVGEAMSESERRGVAVPAFKLVAEEREADEGGRFVVRAKFQELDCFTGQPVGESCARLDEVFAEKKSAPKPETAEDKAKREAEALSQTLSV